MPECKPTSTDVCVIGGGPAGSTAALRLASLGHDVCLVESAAFPRRRIGESLTPGIVPLLEYLGVLSELRSGDVLTPAITKVAWGDAKRSPEDDRRMGASGLVVDRGRFDNILMKSAKAAGVDVMQPARAGSAKHVAGGWHVPVTCGRDRRIIQARFLVDAAGKRSVIPGKTEHDGPPTLAMFAYWNQTGLAPGSTRVEAGSNEWFWGAALPDGTFNAAVFMDPARCRTIASGGGTRSSTTATYERLLQSSALLAPCLAGTRVSDVIVCDASRRFSTTPTGPDFIRVGESSFAIDPLSSQGVQAALTSAVQAGTVVHTVLTQPENARLAREFYTARQREAVTRDREASAGFYRELAADSPQPFWQKRAAPSARAVERREHRSDLPSRQMSLQLAPDVRVVDVPVIQGNMVCAAAGIEHANLERPVAWLEGTAIAALLSQLESPIEAGALIDLWSAHIPRKQAHRTLAWLWARDLIVPVGIQKPMKVLA